MRTAAFAIVIAYAAAALSGTGPAVAQGEGSWRGSAGRAEILNGGSSFAVACTADAADRPAVVLMLEPGADGSALPQAETLLVQISSRADAYVIESGTDISTWFLPVTAAPDGRLVSAAAPLGDQPAGDAGEAAQIAGIVADLRAGMNLVIGGEGFARAERYTLRGSERAIAAVLADCN